jgi:Carboxypeptidase regulatory-like domain
MSSKVLRVTVFILLTSVACVTQVSTSLNGTVTDSTGAAVANADVTLTFKETNVKRTSRTDEQGQFGFPDVPQGAFVLKVTSQGFQTKEVEGVAGISQSNRINVVLAIGSITSPVTVEASSESPSLEATWNSWVEAPGKSPSFHRLETVHTKNDYQLVLDLAAFAYAPKDKSVSARPAGSGLLQWMQHQKDNSVRLKILMVPDPALLSASGQRVQNFDINLGQLKKYLSGGKHKIPKDSFLALQKRPQSDFRFGTAQFEFHTGDHEGSAYIGLSLWAGDTPLDEILVPVCISDAGDPDSCELRRNAMYHSDPLNALPLALEKDAPVTSLHFFDFDSTRAIGVFRSKNGDYLTWSIANLADSLGSFIEKILLKNLEKEVSEDAIQQTGYELYNLLLPSGHPDADRARNEIQGLTAERIKMPGPLADAPPFVIRIATFNPGGAFFVPLGMMAVPVDGRKYFLGDYFRVASPLPFQNYQPAQACVSRWVMLMAPDDDQSPKELVNARDQFSTWANACIGADCIDTMPKFETWIGEPTIEKQSTALLILSHYENDSLTFDHKEFVSPSAIIRQFQSPSIAVVDACAAAAPGADEFVKRLNESGFEAVVATTTTVTPIMAGQYFNLLAKQLVKHKGEADYSISKAHFDAVQELRTAQSNPGKPESSPYGAKALIYSLWGNGSLRLCPLTPTTVPASQR